MSIFSISIWLFGFFKRTLIYKPKNIINYTNKSLKLSLFRYDLSSLTSIILIIINPSFRCNFDRLKFEVI